VVSIRFVRDLIQAKARAALREEASIFCQSHRSFAL
jgi:hypothetical protein